MRANPPSLPSLRMSRRLALLVPALCVVLVAGCGGGSKSQDPTERVPAKGGLRDRVRAAEAPNAASFPATGGKTLQQVADEVGSQGPDLAFASSIFTTGRPNRVAFGLIDSQGRFVYQPTALYVAPKPGSPAKGPYVAPADVLLTEGRYRSKQAATEQDPFSAVYSAQVPFAKAGTYAVLAISQSGGKKIASTGSIKVLRPSQDKIPEVGQAIPKIKTDTLASAKGNIGSIDTRSPAQPDMHEKSFDQLVGKKPVALVIATPQLCQSRVCGPVVDIATQMKAKYGSQMAFIHQEVYTDNDPNKGLREPLRQLGLQTEPWLFVVNKQGKITARLEGSIGLRAFEAALKTGLR
jgi:hypothetical protein